MSDQPKQKIELRELLVAVKNVTDWYGLGVHLSLPRHMLDKIKAERLPVEENMRETLKKWLDYDPEASWEKLASAMEAMDKRAVAESVRSRATGESGGNQAVAARSSSQQVVSPIIVYTRDHDDDAEKRLILGKIKASYSLLMIKIRSAIQACKVDASDVREFLINYHEGECDIPDVNDLKKIFESITKAKLWRYDHYSLLENLAESFIPDGNPARAEMTEYVCQLTAFYDTTSIIDFLKASDQEDPDDDDHPISPKRYNRRYRKLTVKVKVDPNIPMKYVKKFWASLMKEFNLPPLSAIIDNIKEGSLTITWLVLPHIVNKIRATYYKSVDFFKCHNIIKIELYGGLPLYDEKWMEGSTPLFRASYTGNFEKVKTLIEKGADVNQRNDHAIGYTPLTGASLGCGDINIVRLLLEKGARVNIHDEDGWSALMAASWYGHTDVVKLLLEYKADVNIHDLNGLTALIEACMYSSTDTVTLLLAHGAVIDQYEKGDGMTALMYASMVSNTETVKVLLQHGASLDLTDDEGQTALMFTSWSGHADTARALLEKGATVDIKDDDGDTALVYASAKDHPETVKVLLEFGAEVDLQFDSEDGGTALTVASRKGHTLIVKILLSHGALVDYQDKHGQTPLHHASFGGHVDTVTFLLEKGAKVNLQEEDGWTALFLAAKQGQDKVVKTLLDHGAAVDIKSKSGLTALDIARAECHQAVCEVIEQHLNQGAKVEPQQTGGQEDGESQDQVGESGQDSKTELTETCGREDSESQDQVGESGQDSKTELTEEQRSEVRSVSERLWYQLKRVFLREMMEKKERTGQLQGDPSPRITDQPKGRRSILNLFNRLGRRRRRQTQRQVVGTAPVPEHR